MVLCFVVWVSFSSVCVWAEVASACVRDVGERDDARGVVLEVGPGTGTLTEALLERGADPNAARRNGERALHLAAEHRAIECVLVLLDHGADPSALAYRRDTALTLARRRDAQQRHRGREEIARILRAAVDTKAGKPR